MTTEPITAQDLEDAIEIVSRAGWVQVAGQAAGTMVWRKEIDGEYYVGAFTPEAFVVAAALVAEDPELHPEELAAESADREPPLPWPTLGPNWFFGVEEPARAGDLVHIWRRSHTGGRIAACGKTRKIAGVKLIDDTRQKVLCHQCRKAHADAAAAPTPDTSAPTAPSPVAVAPALAAVDLHRIRTDGGTQARAGLNQDTVTEYAEALVAGAHFPPPVVMYDGADYWLADGFHRVAAHRANGVDRAAITVEVRPGTRRDAVLYAVGANAAHGLRRTRGDVQRAIEVLLRDEEWGKWSDREIARQVGCDHKTVSAARERLAAGGEIPHLPERKAPDGKSYPAERSAMHDTAVHDTPAPAPPAPPDPVLVEFKPRVEALGLWLYRATTGEYELSGPSLEPALFQGRKGLDDYLSAREKEARKAPSAEDSDAVVETAPPLDVATRVALAVRGWLVTGETERRGDEWCYSLIVLYDARGSTRGPALWKTDQGIAAILAGGPPSYFVPDPAAILTAAGWVQRPDDAHEWVAPAADEQGRYTVIGFEDAAELATAAAIVVAEPTISGDALAVRLLAPAAEPAPAVASDDPIPLDVRVLAEAYGLTLTPADAPGEFYLFWPDEADDVDAFTPFNAEWAREWMMSDGPVGAERFPKSLYSRAVAAGWHIVGAHAEGRLIVMPADDDTNTVTEELTPAELEARIAPAVLADPDSDLERRARRLMEHMAIVTTDAERLTVEGQVRALVFQIADTARKDALFAEVSALAQRVIARLQGRKLPPPTPSEARTAAGAAEQRAANRDNPAWQAGASAADDLAWGIVELLGQEGKAREPARALHYARQLVAQLERELGQPAGLVSIVYHRLAEWEGTRAPLDAQGLRELDDNLAQLEDLAGDLDDLSYEDLAARLGAVRGRKAAA